MFSLPSPVEDSNIKQECDVESAESPSSLSVKDAAELKDKSCISSQVSCWESFDSDDSCEDNGAKGTENTKNGRKNRPKKTHVETEVAAAYPEPRLPFPCLSSLSTTEQNTYVGYLMSKKTRSPPQVPHLLFKRPAGCCDIQLSNNPFNISGVENTSKQRSNAIHEVFARCG